LISSNSQKLIGKNHKPIYSPERYQMEIENLKLRKEQAAQIKDIQDREREYHEMKEVYKYQD